jgi:hypothetical protein
MKRLIVAALTAAVLTMSVSYASARTEIEEFSVQTLVTSVTPGDVNMTPNEKWDFFTGKQVTTEGIGSIGTTEYQAALDATLRGKLSPDGTAGVEFAEVTLSLAGGSGDLECYGAFQVRRYVDDRYPDTSPVPYGESGEFLASCDDGSKVNGEVVGEFGYLDDTPGFVVTLDGMARL